MPFRAPPGVALVRITHDTGQTILEAFRPGTEQAARHAHGDDDPEVPCRRADRSEDVGDLNPFVHEPAADLILGEGEHLEVDRRVRQLQLAQDAAHRVFLWREVDLDGRVAHLVRVAVLEDVLGAREAPLEHLVELVGEVARDLW